MTTTRMHENEFPIDTALVQRLLAAQFPAWAALPLHHVASAGTDNALFRLGDELVIRLPRIDWAVGQARKAQQWLPRITPHLPLRIPEPVALGEPGSGYPWPWSIHCHSRESGNPLIAVDCPTSTRKSCITPLFS
jgi:aminoglycoside phosphotransferase (APT) family kinase protein